MSTTPKPEPKPQNPALKAMGLPRFRLPSRNWMIFWTVVGSWTGLWYYDKYERKRIQAKWCKAVEHLAKEPLSPKEMPRKITLYMMAPPGDHINATIEFVREYVKPVLVAGGMEWEVVDARREGELRVSIADRIRAARRKSGERYAEEVEDDKPAKAIVEQYRQSTGVLPYSGVTGDIVIGRQTWKEYLRGLHEGYLGPLDNPVQPEPEKLLEKPLEMSAGIDTPEGEEKEDVEKKEEEKKKDEKPQPKPIKAAYIPASVEAYSGQQLPASIPQLLGPVVPITYPGILGFSNTPRRIYNFLTRRRLADQVGAQVAAAVLGAYENDWKPETEAVPNLDVVSDSQNTDSGLTDALTQEERYWPKATRKREETDTSERVWLDPVVVDERITSRLPKFVLSEEVSRLTKDE